MGISVAQDLWAVQKQTFSSNMLNHSTMQAAGKGALTYPGTWPPVTADSLPSCAITGNVL